MKGDSIADGREPERVQSCAAIWHMTQMIMMMYDFSFLIKRGPRTHTRWNILVLVVALSWSQFSDRRLFAFSSLAFFLAVSVHSLSFFMYFSLFLLCVPMFFPSCGFLQFSACMISISALVMAAVG